MKRKLPSLVLALTIVIVARSSWGRSPDLPVQNVPPRTSDAATASPASGNGTSIIPASASTPVNTVEVSGQELLTKAIRAVDAQRSVGAQMRHRITMFGHELVGTGSYQQQGSGDERMLRLDMKVKVADSFTSMQQVCDGRFLWIRREVGDASMLGRVDLRRIRAATREGVSPEVASDVSNVWMLLGGLPQLIARLDNHFQFAPARQAKLEETDVWVIDGTWRPASLAMLLPSQAENIKAGKPIDPSLLSEQIPTQVRVVLRRSDNFPLRIDYLRQGIAAAPDEPPPVTPLLSMELFDIHLGEAIDPLTFAYKPGDKEVADHTELYLKNLGLK